MNIIQVMKKIVHHHRDKCVHVKTTGKGRTRWLCALGEQSDDRFHEDYIREWEAWYSAIVSGENPPWQEKINMFILDKITIEGWLEEGLWDEQLRSFILQQK